MPHLPYPEPDDPFRTYGLDSQHMLQLVRHQAGQYISREFAERISLNGQHHRFSEMIGEKLALSLTAEVLTEHLPPHTITHHVQYEHPEAIGRPGVAVDARFARPIDHFAATYRRRWWGRLLGLHRREIRYQFVPVPYLVSVPVQCDHQVTVDVRASWTYPNANLVLPAETFGPVVLDGRDVRSESQATYRERQGDALADMVKRHARSRGDSW